MTIFSFLLAAATLPEITVEASRLDLAKSEIPSHVDVITREAIESSLAISTVDLLEKRANLNFRKTNANPALAQISMRGYGANGFGRVKIVVDGETLNNPDMSPQNLLRVPLGSLERVEILHGPQTVLHGGDASAGVINLTSDAKDFASRVRAETTVGSFNTVGARLNARTGDEKTGLTAFADFGYERSDGYRENGDYEIWSLKGGVRQALDDRGSFWSFKTFFADSRYGLPGGIYTGKASYGVDYGDWRERPRHADDPHSDAHNLVYGLSTSASLAFDDENSASLALSYRKRNSKSYETIEYDVDNIVVNLDYRCEAPLGKLENRLITGGDMKFDFLDSGVNDFRRFSGAVFAREELFLLDELSVFGGARGEWWRTANRCTLDSKRDFSIKGEAAGEIGVNWRPIDGLKVFARWTKFYHAPLADEMISAYGRANLSLSPESGHTTEIGVDFSLASELDFNFTAHYTSLKDEIAYFNYANVNLPIENRKAGFDTSLVWSRERVGSAGILYSFVESEELVPLVPRQQLRVFGEAWLCDFLAVGGGYRFVGEQRFGGDFEGKGGMLPAYGIFDVNARLKPTSGIFKGWTLSLVIDNLFDRRYCDYGEYFDPWYVYPAAGRSLSLTLSYEF